MSAAPCLAQRAAQARKPLDRLAAVVPDDVGVYVEIAPLLGARSRITETTTWRVIEQFAGSDAHQDWRKRLMGGLGIESADDLRPLARTRFALAADSWDTLDDGVLLLELSRMFGTSDAIRILSRSGPTHEVEKGERLQLFRTDAGLWLAVSESVAAISRTREPGSLLHRIMARIDGIDATSLATLASFSSRSRDLTASSHAIAYWQSGRPVTSTAPSEAANPFWPDFSSAVLGLRVGRARIDITVRDLSPQDRPFQFQPRVRLDQISALPQSTLAAWATSIDVDEVFDSLSGRQDQPVLAELFDLFEANVNANDFHSRVLDNLKPRCIILLGCDFESLERLPQFAVIMDSIDSRQVVDALVEFARQIRAASATDDSSDPDDGIVESEYLGYSIYELPMPHHIDTAADTLAALVVDRLSPAFAAFGDSVIVSTSAEHVRQIIGSATGMAPSVGEVLDLSTEKARLRRSVGVALVQPAFALDTLRHWQTLLDERRRAASHGGEDIGVTFDIESGPGKVLIKDVSSNGPAAGQLEAGDIILGCDGLLLPLTQSLAFLQTRLTAHPARGNRFRVLRGDDLLDVRIIASSPPADQLQPTGLGPVWNLLRPIEPVAQQVSLALYGITRLPRRPAEAQLIVRFEPPPKRKNNAANRPGANDLPAGR